MQSALAVIEAKAYFDGGEQPVHVRVSGMDDKLYLDLADAEWRAVEIDADGWRIIGDPPVRFRRQWNAVIAGPGARRIAGRATPAINVQDDRDAVLITAWLLAALLDRGPYPMLALTGEQGLAKSSLAALLHSLEDPDTAPLRTLPRDDRDLFIAATNGHVIAIDNVSSLPPWLSDTLCRLSTGGGFATRQLYTNLDEVLLDAMRPIILTGMGACRRAFRLALCHLTIPRPGFMHSTGSVAARRSFVAEIENLRDRLRLEIGRRQAASLAPPKQIKASQIGRLALVDRRIAGVEGRLARAVKIAAHRPRPNSGNAEPHVALGPGLANAAQPQPRLRASIFHQPGGRVPGLAPIHTASTAAPCSSHSWRAFGRPCNGMLSAARCPAVSTAYSTNSTGPTSSGNGEPCRNAS